MEQVYNAEERNEHQVTAVLSLINMGIKTVPEGVLRTKFEDITMKMLHILKDYANSDNNTIIKAVFGILSVLIRTQELITWSYSTTIQTFNAMLNPFCIHSKPKVITYTIKFKTIDSCDCLTIKICLFEFVANYVHFYNQIAASNIETNFRVCTT